MAKKLFLFKRDDDDVDWDEYDGFVVCAKDKEHAIKFVNEYTQYSKGVWKPFLEAFPDTTITCIGLALTRTKYGIVLDSFNAG